MFTLLTAVSQFPHLRIRKRSGLSGVLTQLRLTAKVQIVVSCHYLVMCYNIQWKNKLLMEKYLRISDCSTCTETDS